MKVCLNPLYVAAGMLIDNTKQGMVGSLCRDVSCILGSAEKGVPVHIFVKVLYVFSLFWPAGAV